MQLSLVDAQISQLKQLIQEGREQMDRHAEFIRHNTAKIERNSTKLQEAHVSNDAQPTNKETVSSKAVQKIKDEILGLLDAQQKQLQDLKRS